MSAIFTTKKGDTSNSLRCVLRDVNGVAVNLTGATVKFSMQSWPAANLIINKVAATVVNPLTGDVRYDWAALDVSTPGLYRSEIEVTYPTGKIETFPNNDYITVNILADLA